jgi:hypothetical protein
MTKAEIEKLITFIDERIPKRAFDNQLFDNVPACSKGIKVMCEINGLFDLLREYPTEEEKTCGPDWEAMYKRNADELDKAQLKIESLKRDYDHLSTRHAYYTGAVAAMETIFGRKFEPHK